MICYFNGSNDVLSRNDFEKEVILRCDVIQFFGDLYLISYFINGMH